MDLPDKGDVRHAARVAGDHPVVEWGARLGYVANGLLHLLLGWLALQLAFGTRHAASDQSGAFNTLAGSGIGKVLLWVAAIGFLLLALWQLTDAALQRKAGAQIKAVGKFIAYAAMAWSAIAVLRHAAKSSASQTTDITRSLMSKPGGVVLVIAVGIAIAAIGIYHVYKGARQKFRDDLEEQPPAVAAYAGIAGYVAKGIALLIVGVLFMKAGIDHRASESQGLDGALRALLKLPLGKVLLVLVAVGLMAMGIYSFFRAKLARV